MRTLAMALALLALAGCASERRPRLPRLEEEPPPQVMPPAPVTERYRPAEGSLWHGPKSQRLLAFENRATQIGDVVTVMIEESARAENEARTELERESDIQATVDSAVALQTVVTRPILRLLRFLGFTEQQPNSTPTTEVEIIDATTSTEFEGQGKASREASFTTKVACIVTEVTASGLLRVEGSRNLTINNETQVIRLTGYVRPEDVQIDNTVPSALIASADIRYTGVGVTSENQRPPWLMRILKKVLPF